MVNEMWIKIRFLLLFGFTVLKLEIKSIKTVRIFDDAVKFLYSSHFFGKKIFSLKNPIFIGKSFLLS